MTRIRSPRDSKGSQPRTVVDAVDDAWSANWMAFVDWRHAVLAGDPRLAFDIARSNLDGLAAAADVVGANVTRFFLRRVRRSWSARAACTAIQVVSGV